MNAEGELHDAAMEAIPIWASTILRNASDSGTPFLDPIHKVNLTN